jgi:fumarate reductase (CoM/CoB) subunit A
MHIRSHTLATDVLVIGAGAAGCRAAIAAADHGTRVTLLAKGRFTHCGSSFYPLTHGLGFTTALPGAGVGDGIQAHYEEILAAGLGMASPALARALAEDAPARYAELVHDFSLPFRTDAEGTILYIRPDYGSGSVRAGGATIPALRKTFAREVGRRAIDVLENTSAIRLLGDDAGCRGVVALADDGDLLVIAAGATVLATGGYAALFEHSLTSGELLGDGYALALDLGAELVNMEFYQLILGITAPIRGMIIAESTLESLPEIINGRGERFLSQYLPAGVSPEACMAERAHTGPFHAGRRASYFDIALFEEIAAGRGAASGGIHCDFTGVEPGARRGFRPDWVQWSLERGLDVRETPVEIAPCVHANNGGILIDTRSATRVPGLYACGEAAGGPHWANRIGGNQMSGAQVFGARAGASAAAYARERPPEAADADEASPERDRIRQLTETSSGVHAEEILRRLQMAMYRNLGVRKNAGSLGEALAVLDTLGGEDVPRLMARPGQAALALTVPHALNVARLIVQSAMWRRESRGPHYRDDYPDRDDAGYGRPLVWRRAPGEAPACEARTI